MLVTAMDNYQLAKRAHKENVKAQYTDKKGGNGAVDYFRASGMGYGDRKLIYTFFAHQLPKSERSAKNLRQLENGDFVHDRYQSAWEEMGILLSMEERLSSVNDEYLGALDEDGNRVFPWEFAGHYDGLLDMNIIRAHALGLCKINSLKNEETGDWEIEVEVDDAYANSVGLFTEDYVPVTQVADIKTMNPWGFKRIKENGDTSDIQGYIDQIMFYMYMLNTPYGSIYIESKDSNDVCEVQIVWKDMFEGVEYSFDENLHGKQSNEQVRLTVDNGRFFGDETREGMIPRIDRIYKAVEALRKAEETGDTNAMAELMPGRCADKPTGFPCSWGHKTGQIQTCEFFDHCWHSKHGGVLTSTYEACPPEAVWSFFEETEDPEQGEAIEVRIDSRKVPTGVTEEAFLALVEAGVLDYTKFLVDTDIDVPVAEAMETAQNTQHLFSDSGELILTAPVKSASEECVEYMNADGKKSIKCGNCNREVTYQRLGNGGVKKCDFCQHVNKVVKL